MNDLSGTWLGPYELKQVIGKGGMATVYRAFQPSVGREVAIKILATELADDEEFIARFEREARIIASLQHPHILTVYDFGREGSLMYLVMRLMTGGSLALELRGGALAPERVIKLTRQIASALEYAHLRGIVHRDLKPTNVLLDELGNAYLTDFGIAKLVSGSHVTGLTVPGTVMGTPTYMAPEQWRSEPVDGRTDVYALGVIVYQMLLGQVPFAAETPHGLMYQHLDMQPPSPHTLRPSLPLTIEPVIRKALAKNREDRYASAAELAEDLDHTLHSPARLPEQTDFDAQPVRPPRRPEPETEYDRLAEDNLLAMDKDVRDTQEHTLPGTGPTLLPPVKAAPPQPLPRVSSTPPVQQVYKAPVYQSPPPPTIGQQAPYTPVISESYSDPLYVPRRPIRSSSLPGLWLGIIVALSIILIVVAVFVGTELISFSGEDTNPTTPATNTVVPTLTVNPQTLPIAAITFPPENAVGQLGETIPIQFTVSGPLGITRVELRRFGRAINTIALANPTTYQGSFMYPLDSTGAHTLEIVPFSGSTQGIPATVTIQAQ